MNEVECEVNELTYSIRERWEENKVSDKESSERNASVTVEEMGAIEEKAITLPQDNRKCFLCLSTQKLI